MSIKHPLQLIHPLSGTRVPDNVWVPVPSAESLMQELPLHTLLGSESK